MAYYIIAKANRPEERLVVEDPKQGARIISSVHDSCHMGLNRTNDMVACKYYWPGMSKHVASYVSLLYYHNITVTNHVYCMSNADCKL